MTATPRRGPTASAPHQKTTDLSDFSEGCRMLVKNNFDNDEQQFIKWKTISTKNTMAASRLLKTTLTTNTTFLHEL